MELEWAKNIIKMATDISKYVRKHTIIYASLRRNQQHILKKTISLQLPVATRWTSHMNCLRSVNKSKAALQACVVEPQIADTMRQDHQAELRTTILADQTWTQLEDVITLLQPFLAVILDLEKDVPRLSWVYRHYSQLRLHAQSTFVSGLPIGKQVKKFVVGRWNWLRRPVMSVAYVLDPHMAPFGYPGEILKEVGIFLEKYYDEKQSALIYSQICALVSRQEPFDTGILWRSAPLTPPITWWTANFKNSCPELTKLAIRILSMPASAASSERNWSAFNFIHSASRNRLLNRKVQKLINIYWNSRLLTDVQDDGTYFDEEELEDEGIIDLSLFS